METYQSEISECKKNDLTSISCNYWEKIDTSAMKLAHLQNNEFDSNGDGNRNPDILVHGNNFQY